jgi:multimeric flavodoxin WrbA
VVVTGSPRKGGNSDLMAQAFAEGARQAGHSVVLFEAARRKLSCCTACNRCFHNGQACAASDAFNELASVLETADTIVFCTPLYWFTFPASLKIVIDKLYAFIVGERPLHIKEAVLMVCAETDDRSDFEAIIKTYELILDYQQWKNAGILTVPKVRDAGDIEKTDGLDRARAMGLRI